MVARLQYLRFCLFEMFVNVVFVIRCLYSAVSLTLVKEQRFIRIIYYYYYYVPLYLQKISPWFSHNVCFLPQFWPPFPGHSGHL